LDYKSWIKKFEKEVEVKSNFIIYQYIDGEILIYKTRYKKDGNFAKGIKLDIEKIFEFRYQTLLHQEDIEILKLLQTFGEELEGEVGYLLLSKLLSSGRFVNANWSPFNSKKANFTLSFEEERVELIYPKVDSIFRTFPLIGKDESCFYIFDKSLDYEQFITLKKAPNFDRYQLFEVYRFFRDRFKIATIPPKSYHISTIDVTPKAVLTLQANRYIQLSFLYENYEVKYDRKNLTIKYTKDGEVEIVRDREFEEKKVQEIESFGFKNLEGTFIVEGDTQTKLSKWKHFLEMVDKLDFIVKYENFDMKFVEEGEIVATTEDRKNWFNLSFDIKIGRRKYSLIPIVIPILKEIDSYEELPEYLNFEFETNKFITFKTENIKPIIKTLFELRDRLNRDKIEIKPYEAHLIELDEGIEWRGSKELRKLSQQLKHFEGIEQVSQPKGLKVELRDYQLFGLSWLLFLHKFRFGGILADDMGLGKTIQTLSLLLKLKEMKKLKKPSLIVLPTSLIGNWKVEVEKFAPDLSYLSLYGNDRWSKFRKIDKVDIVFTTYSVIVRDVEDLIKREFEYIILDEAQKIKNPSSKVTQVVKKLNSNYKLALSGTPIENHLGELWSIFSFLMPGFLGSLKEFKKLYQNPIEKESDNKKKEELFFKIKPFILRRTKEKVAKELPEKVEIVKYVEFSEEEKKLYESIRILMDKKVQEAILKNGLNRSQIVVLDALLKLRQVCCHPALLNKIDEAKKIKTSSKLELLLDLVEELLAEGRKILLFSQFTSMIDIIKEKFEKLNISYSLLTGATKNRDKVINQFKNGETDIFLISLKAGGVGLNLTEADTVIHYDPWWNPAAQNQATDRAYRIGQDKKVFVYKLVVKNSIEERIIELQNSKKSLTSIYENEESKEIKAEELLSLLKG